MCDRPRLPHVFAEEVPRRPSLHPLERAFNSFLRSPLSVRRAMTVIVTATVVSVLAGGVLISVVDNEEFPSVGTGLWWALQTVTTVGYGDVVPHQVLGRIVGAVIMLESIAFVAIVTAAITSNFVERARRRSEASADSAGHEVASKMPSNAELAAQLATISAQLDGLRLTLEQGADPTPEQSVVSSEPLTPGGQ